MTEETKKAEPRLDHWERVDSSNIAEIRYNSIQVRLEVRFKNQGAKEFYSYQAVPRELWIALMVADSKGSFLNTNIKKQFKCVKMEQVARMDDPDQADAVDHEGDDDRQAREDDAETKERNRQGQVEADMLAQDEGAEL